MSTPTLGSHIAARLVEIGVTEYFCVPGDFNMTLLDQLSASKELKMVNCCNELEAGYAADGYARAKGVGCLAVTFTVGGLSAINAVAAAYAEDLPVICITGVPNSNDFGDPTKTLHHTTAEESFNQEYRCFQEVTKCQTVIRALDGAYEKIDHAIAQALYAHKPVLIQVACNMASLTHPMFEKQPVPFSLTGKTTNEVSMREAVKSAADFLNAAAKVVLVVGSQVRLCKAHKQAVQLADACQYPVAVMPRSKGMFPETHPRFMGVYWANISSEGVCEAVESADAYIFVGPTFNDYSTCAFSQLLSESKMVRVGPRRVTVAGKRTFGCVNMAEFLPLLAGKLTPNDTTFQAFKRTYVGVGRMPSNGRDAPLKGKLLYSHLQEYLTDDVTILVDTGDALFNTMKLNLPEKTGFEVQLQYGSIGWSVGATLGFALGRPSTRMLSLIGDGSFQVTAQGVSTMIRVGISPLIILVNNSGYVIEEEIHAGPYNKISDWNYTAVVEGMAGSRKNLYTAKVRTEAELIRTLKKVQSEEHNHKVCFVEVFLHPEDCSADLLEWGCRLAEYNARPPNPK
ncbi:Pyruvate decarboxylase 2 [Trebouxia sp. C0009 RCD-2024]